MLRVRLVDELHLDGGEALDPRPQVIGEDKGTTTALNRAQLARLDRSVECRPADARDGARLRDGVRQRSFIFISPLEARMSGRLCSRARGRWRNV